MAEDDLDIVVSIFLSRREVGLDKLGDVLLELETSSSTVRSEKAVLEPVLGFSKLSSLFSVLEFMLGSTGVAGISLRAGPVTGQPGLTGGKTEELLLDPSWLGLGLETDLAWV